MTRRTMSEQAFLVLTALARAPQHGYAIVREVREISGGRVQLRVGTVYGVLDRLLGDELVEAARDEVHQGRLRRYYRLTGAGLLALTTEAERMAANARAATTAIHARQSGPATADGWA